MKMLHKHIITASALATTVALAACVEVNTGDQQSSTSSTSSRSSRSVSSASTSEDSSIRETHNVTYIGIVEPAGISIYQEGTHRLVLDGAKFILLESSTVDLNGYVNEYVQVFGSLRPTVEAGGMILRVTNITLLETSSSSEEVSSSSELSSSSSSSTSSRIPEQASSVSTNSSSSISVATSSVNSALESRIALMAKEDLASSEWTQKYCTGHIEFCIPVHKNWWYNSFGTTSTYLWHVEISTEEISTIGQGPIEINLLSGSAPVADGTVRTEGQLAVGYRSWTDDRYFVIKGDARLQQAISYITSNLSSYAE